MVEKSKIVDVLDKSFNSKRNVIKISKHNTIDHELAKCKLCILLRKDNIDFVTEAIFKNNQGRADVFLIDRLEVYEVLESEIDKKFNKKKEMYPSELTIFGLRAKEILKRDFVL